VPVTAGESPLPNLVDEADRVLAASRTTGVEVRLLGGLAIRRICPSAAKEPLSRTYADLDLMITSQTPTKAMNGLMSRLGYQPHESFNALHGDRRLYYFDQPNSRHVDVFVDSFRMCHVLDLKARVGLHPETLSPSDLLLTKLQVVELNHKDVLDLLALLHDQPWTERNALAIDPAYLEELWSADWPLWRTCGETIRKVRRAVGEVLDSPSRELVLATVSKLEAVHATGRRSLAWRIRSRVGDRIRWYELPEEV
jgi:Uncharacterised nucleotidyltransferase